MNTGWLLESLALFTGSRTRRLLVVIVLCLLLVLTLAGCEVENY
jgi:hypothetical protein